MTQTISAIFENGVLRPTAPLNLPEQAHVRLTIEPLEVDEKVAEKLAAVIAFWKKTKPHSTHLSRDQLHERR